MMTGMRGDAGAEGDGRSSSRISDGTRERVDLRESVDSMDDLIARVLRNEATLTEQRELGEWAESSRENSRRLAETRRVLELGVALRTGGGSQEAPTIAELLERRSRRRLLSRLPSVASVSWRSVRHAGMVAAAVALAGFIALISWPGGKVPSHLASTQFVTGPGETVTAMLGDGTVVRLGPSSRLRVEDARESREVWLDGRAYFAVTKNPKLPFRVRTRAGEAHVLGTRFDLEVRDEGLQVMVVEGNVELEAKGSRIGVSANERARVGGDAEPVRETIAPDEAKRSLEWMGDFLVFEGTPLGQAAKELSLHYGLPVEVMDSVLARETVHGWFANEPLEDVMKVVCRAVRAHCVVTAAGVSIEP